MVATPTRELGYGRTTANGSGLSWWQFDEEQTPELRWPQSIAVYDAMRRQDAQAASVLRAVTLPVRSTSWRIDPAGARDEVVALVAEDLGLPISGQPDQDVLPRARGRFSWAEHLRLALLELTYGHAFFEQVYRLDGQGRARLAKLAARMPRTIAAVNVADDGGLKSIEQYALGPGDRTVTIPVGRLVAYVNDREGGNWLGTSLLRPAYKHWLIKDRLLRVQAQTIERNGMGVPLYTGAEDEEDLAAGQALASAWRAGDAAGAAVPFGANLYLRGVEGQLPDALPAIRYHDEQIARAVLAHFLNLGTQTGSWALGTTFSDFFIQSLQAVAQQIADIATQHIVEDLVDVNWGPDEPAPRIVNERIGSQQPATAAAIQQLLTSGAVFPDVELEESLRQQYGLPPKAAPSPTPPTGDDA